MDVDAVIRDLSRLADRELRKRGAGGRKSALSISPEEQLRRFLSGEEKGRVLRGEVTPADYAVYERHMLKRLGAIK